VAQVGPSLGCRPCSGNLGCKKALPCLDVGLQGIAHLKCLTSRSALETARLVPFINGEPVRNHLPNDHKAGQEPESVPLCPLISRLPRAFISHAQPFTCRLCSAPTPATQASSQQAQPTHTPNSPPPRFQILRHTS